jgi:diguanylate cyclase (GGDEF)-like protein
LVDYAKKVTILYVEDEDDIREGYQRALTRYCKHLYLAKDGQEGVEQYKKYSPDIVISDINMPRRNGIEMAKEIIAINPNQRIIFTTAHTEATYTIEALNLQVDGYLIKPVDKKKLKAKLEKVSKEIVLEQENIQNQKILQKILDNQTSITILTDFKTIEFASKSFFNLFGVKNKEEFFLVHSNILDIFVKHDNYIGATTKEEFLQKYELASEESRIISIPSVLGEVKAFYIEIDTIDKLFILTLTDITEIQLERLNATHRATHDNLTGVFNRAKFNEIFHTKYESYKRYERAFSIAILDIDFFKKVNDDYGHQIGDEILKSLAKHTLTQIRSTDFFARWGGEEFVLLMDETSSENAYKVCEKLRVSIETLHHQDLPQITISIGLAQINPSDTKESLFKKADKALYEAKNSGRNRVVTYE